MSHTRGGRPLTDGRQLGWVCSDLAMANYVAQVIDLALKKCTFLHLRTKLVCAKAGQDGAEVVQVILQGTTIHEYII